MKCPHLTGRKVKVCRESNGEYIPSRFELEEYCRTDKSLRCPFRFRPSDEDYGMQHREDKDAVSHSL